MVKLTVLLFLSSVLSAGDALYDIRKAAWGMSLQTVESSETIKPELKTEKALVYSTSLNGSDVYLMYDFQNDKLVSAGYMLKNTGMPNVESFQIGSKWMDSLNEKYGKAKIEILSTGKSYGDVETSIAMGRTKVRTVYTTDRSNIELTIFGSKLRIGVILKYSDSTKKLVKDTSEF
jgi:hypothetical protein